MTSSARRYHWLGESVDDFVCEPHHAIDDLTDAKPASGGTGTGADGMVFMFYKHSTEFGRPSFGGDLGFELVGSLPVAYLPALVFGPSPRSGLTPGQRNILTALTHELTRAGKSGRADKARIFVGGKPHLLHDHRVAAPPGFAVHAG